MLVRDLTGEAIAAWLGEAIKATPELANLTAPNGRSVRAGIKGVYGQGIELKIGRKRLGSVCHKLNRSRHRTLHISTSTRMALSSLYTPACTPVYG